MTILGGAKANGRREYHIVHFMGHGEFDGKNGALVFDDRQISGEHFSTMIARESSVRLIVLNACNTARTGTQVGIDPFAGVASSLVMKGLPAVVAMQFPITDGAAILFSGQFYSQLAAGKSFEEAVSEGRASVWENDPDGFEWATPMLFLQASGNEPMAAPVPAELANRQTAEDIKFQPYMVDRQAVVEQLTLACGKDKAHPENPVICFVPGDSRQCFLELTERLPKEELCDVFNLDARDDGIENYEFKWPKTYTEEGEFQDLLTRSLGKGIPSCPRPVNLESVQKHLAGIHPAVMLYTEINPDDWEDYPDTILQEFADYWKQYPVDPSQRILILVFYHSTVNFATLGYGDIVMSEQARLLGALEAVNGVMMFGLTTGVLVTVLNAIARRGWKARVG